MTGFVCAAIGYKYGVECDYHVVRTQNLLENVVLAAYERYHLDYIEIDDSILINGKVIGRRLAPKDAATASPGILIIEDLEHEGLILLEAGTIFDAPFCEVEVTWQRRLPMLRRISMFLELTAARSKYTAELEARVREAQNSYLESLRAQEEAQRLSRELETKNRELEGLAQALEIKVTERTQRLNESFAQLKRMDIVKSNLLATVSHELRTPLSLIKGPLERIKRGENGDSLRCDDEVLESMSRQVDRLVDIIDGIMEFTMLEFERPDTLRSKVNLNDLAEEAAGEATFEVAMAGISLSTKLSVDPPPFVEGERRFLKTAVANLLSNAIKYNNEGGSVELRVMVNGRVALLSVADSGKGMASDELPKIFERLYRVDQSENHGGSGLGLYLVKKIVDFHGGEVAVESEPGKGSVFTLRLPLVDPETRQAPDHASGPIEAFIRASHSTQGRDQATHESHMDQKQGALLIVEDNVELAEFLRQGLSLHYEVSVAPDAESALITMCSQDFDLVLSDVMLPGMDGLELLRSAGKLGARRPPFLFLTARADDSIKLDALEGGALDYIAKPFDELALRRKIENILLYRRNLLRHGPLGRSDSEERARELMLSDGLSPREIEVAILLARGRSRKEIAGDLGIAIATAKRHIENIYDKLAIGDRFQLFAEYFHSD
jgi:signal transduction histidine kinase/DNA-binding NarL/FixJ family response regulator